MKTFTSLVPVSLAALAIASPLGDRAVFQRHNGTPYRNARRYILQSRVDAPPACAALLPSNTTTPPDLTNTTIPLSSASISPDLSNVTAPLTNTTGTGDNSTTTSSTTDANIPPSVNNTTSVDNSTSTNNSTTLPRRSRRHWRRLAQDDLPAVAQGWQDLCLVSGGDIFTNEPCVNLAGVDGINALLADADPCAQQDNADAMIAFAKSPGVTNTADLIANAIAYRQHPRNTMNILGVIPSTVYCQKAPQSVELIGIVNVQLDDADPGLFGSPNIPLMPFGAPGTCPFGQEPDITTCTCVDATTTDDPTSTNSSNTTDTGAINTTATDTTAASQTISGTSTDTTVLASTTGVASSGVAVSTSSVASATPDLSSDSAAPTQTSVTAVTSDTSSAVAVPSATSGPNFQPDDISGNVNDIDG